MTEVVGKTCRLLALLWASMFSVLLILMVAFPDQTPAINALWLMQLAVIVIWAALYCLRGLVVVSAGVEDRKTTAYGKQSKV